MEGKFGKFETSLARTVARRIQRDEKRAARAKEGRGKEWKKRERSENQARIERGISGFVDKWRKEERVGDGTGSVRGCAIGVVMFPSLYRLDMATEHEHHSTHALRISMPKS
jgi:hypothetical protein